MFAVVDTRSGETRSTFKSYEDADAAVSQYEVDDLWEGTYIENAYEISESKSAKTKAPRKKKK